MLEATDEKINVAARPERDVFESDLEVDEYTEYDKKKMRKKFGRVKSRIQFFEKKFSMKKKGTFKVWETELFLLENLKIKIYLHAVLDSKVVYRVSNRYGASPLATMDVTVQDPDSKKKKKVSIRTSEAQRVFRMRMGYNDQSDAKRTRIGLSSKYYKRWSQKLLAKLIEDAITNAYGTYLLD